MRASSRAVAPFDVFGLREAATQHNPLGFERQEGVIDVAGGDADRCRQLARRCRTGDRHAPADELDECLVRASTSAQPWSRATVIRG